MINILSLPNPETHLPERWRQYAHWLSCQANPSLSYPEHTFLPHGELDALKQAFADSAGISLDDYIRLRRISFVLSRSQSHSQYRAELAVSALETPLGQMLAVFGEKGLCMLKFVDQKGVESELLTVQRERQALFVWRDSEWTDLLRQELAAYFSGSLQTFSVPLDFVGNDSQREVWQTLQNIPYGETRSYAQQAAYLGKANAIRNVAAAASQNKIAILVPDHRISGNEHQGRNKALLAHERAPRPSDALPPPVPFTKQTAAALNDSLPQLSGFRRSRS